MEKFRKLYNALMKRPLGFSLISNILTFVFGCLLFRTFFEDADDLQIALIAEGAYGTRDAHLVNSNIILGKFVSWLQQLTPSVRWHSVLMILFSFVAMTLLTYILSQYRFGRSVSAIVQLGLFYEIYVSLQSAKAAIFICAVGLFAILYCVSLCIWGPRINKKTGKPKSHLGIAVLGYILLFYSIVLRNSAFAIVIVFCFALSLMLFVEGIREKGFRAAGYFCAYIIPVFIAMFILSGINSAAYNSDPEWNYYKEYNKVRTQFTDYRYDLLDYSAHGDELQQEGISENDSYMYLTGQFSDETVVTTQLMQDILSKAGTKKIDLAMIKAYVENVYNTLFAMQPAVIAMIVFVLLIILGEGAGTFSFLLAAGQMILLFIISFYYLYSGRWCRSLLLATLCAIVVFFAGYIVVFSSVVVTEKEKTGREINLALRISIAFLLIIFVGTRVGNEFDYQEYLRNEKNFAVLQMYMEEEKGTLFVADTLTVNDRYRYNVFDALDEGALDNFIVTGGWLTASPIEHGLVERFGYYDPFDALKRGDNVLLIDNNSPERKALFLSEHGDGPRFAASYYETVCGYNLYRVK